MKTRHFLALILTLLTAAPLASPAQPAPDTTFSLLLRVKTAKAVDMGIFNPDTDLVYAVSDPGFGTLQLARGAGNVYDAVLASGLDSGQTYSFRFRINDSIYENVVRQVTANPGMTEYIAWWNDEPINVTTFNVDMTYMVMVSAFDPATDSLDITGTMNNWGGSPLMQRVDTTNVFTLSLPLDPGIVYKYRYRVNRDTARQEFLIGYPRYFRAPDTAITLNHFFYDFNPATVAMTFQCDMRYQEELMNFDPETDYVDVAGNFNNGGGWDLLYLRDNDSICRGTLFFDTAMIGGSPLTFKFRINGDPAREELSGQPPRSYTLHTPALGNPNACLCWFDDTNPNILTPPWVTDLWIQGAFLAGQTVTGTYAYHNINGIPEGNSLYQWYTADAPGGTLTAIDSAWQVNYTIDSTADNGKYLIFEVTPVAAWGDSAVGQTAQIWAGWPVGGVGIGEYPEVKASFYPNPVSEYLIIQSGEQTLNIAVTDLYGREIRSKTCPGAGLHSMYLGDLSSGIYFLVMKAGDRITIRKLVRQ